MFCVTLERAVTFSQLHDGDGGNNNVVWTESWKDHQKREKLENEMNKRLTVIQPSFRVLMKELNLASKARLTTLLITHAKP